MSKKGFSIIVAFDEARGIGKDGVMPWHLPADLKHFKEITTPAVGKVPNVVIMGRKTWESIPEKFRPLPGRINVVITGQKNYILPNNVEKVESLEVALHAFCDKDRKDIGDVFVIGGANVFAEAINHDSCRKLHVTIIYDIFNCDVFFPETPSYFVEQDRSKKIQENKKMFSFVTLTRA